MDVGYGAIMLVRGIWRHCIGLLDIHALCLVCGIRRYYVCL